MKMNFRVNKVLKEFEEGMPDNREIVTRKEYQKKFYKGLLKGLGIIGLLIMVGFLTFPLLSFIGPVMGAGIGSLIARATLPNKYEYKIVENDGVTPIPDSIIENEKVLKKQKGTFRYILEYVIAIIFIIFFFMFLWVMTHGV